jgi:hypothetical protein
MLEATTPPRDADAAKAWYRFFFENTPFDEEALKNELGDMSNNVEARTTWYKETALAKIKN